MRDTFIVMKFTMKEMVRRKSFVVSTLIILALIVVGFNIPNIKKALTDDEVISEKVLIVDNDNVYDNTLNNLVNYELGYDYLVQNKTPDEIKEMVNNKEISFAVEIKKISDNNYDLNYYVDSYTELDLLPTDLFDSLQELYKNNQINKLGLTEMQLSTINAGLNLNIKTTSEEEVKGNIFVMLIMCIVLFYAIYFCALQVSSSITVEKTSKIMETLVTSTSPRNIIIGKTLGIGIAGLLQMLLFLGTAIFCAYVCVDHELLSQLFDFSNIHISLIFITIGYFILGYLTFSLLYAVTGSTVSKPEDIQSANTPVALLSVAAFYLAYFTMLNPTSSLNQFAALFPFSSPFCMPFRIMMGLASATDVLLSFVILIIAIILLAYIAIKIYSNAILNYGSKISIKDMIGFIKQK